MEVILVIITLAFVEFDEDICNLSDGETEK